MDLRREADKEIETLKASLNIQGLTHQIKFSKLHDRRADVIEEFYRKIVSFANATDLLIGELELKDYESIKEKADKLMDQCFELQKFCELNTIYFSEKLINKIENWNSTILNLSIDIYYDSTTSNIDDFITAFEKEKFSLERRNKEIKRVIETEFRELLGARG